MQRLNKRIHFPIIIFHFPFAIDARNATTKYVCECLEFLKSVILSDSFLSQATHLSLRSEAGHPKLSVCVCLVWYNIQSSRE